ncbi:hypothetical protein RO3G_06640 [Rhizopus delemar RA 99-880]|uniref:Protein kinase domain-containing protein n=1 Tax=Rhizopus delemar (strain RA 99-880 / ATCC MYA-4621 / FGSC 9543 / NRRL 43880) TaxID=246409 RepID=I1C0F5_RHIO9|nr:hypothetical protein RO3G_06640 [Rhizopus delemar RA 99-880]|eukprot:EIE81935.1 hypothetical protein RO3G_06640 [Rhizopus delemar RA 99-880]
MGFFKTLDAIVHKGVYQPDSYEKKKHYTFSEVLGSGAFASVKKAIRNKDGKEVAVKIIPKRHMKDYDTMVQDEINLLKGLNHPNVIGFYDYFESRATGGELFERLFERGKFSEKDAVVIIHMKPENLLFKTPDSDADLVICDFGIAKSKSTSNASLDNICGSPGYVAPEVLSQKDYGTPIDMWAVGLCGYMPFRSEDEVELIYEIQHARYDFHERYWKNISEDDDKTRMTASEALSHTWMTSKDIQDIDILETVRENFNPRRKLKSAVDAIRALNRLKNNTSEIREQQQNPITV